MKYTGKAVLGPVCYTYLAWQCPSANIEKEKNIDRYNKFTF